jgi:hypothetical protein
LACIPLGAAPVNGLAPSVTYHGITIATGREAFTIVMVLASTEVLQLRDNDLLLLLTRATTF